MNDAFTIFNTRRNVFPIKDIVATGDIDSQTKPSLSFGASIHRTNNRISTPAVHTSALTAYPTGNMGRAWISARGAGSPYTSPLIIAAKDIIFLQRYRNVHRIVDAASGISNE
jgi:hypothetical protein